MTERWQRVESLCHAALARPASERAAFLSDACGEDAPLRAEVESLIAGAESAQSFLETPLVGPAAVSLIGRQLGAYRLEASIGAGGMGEVYRATDTRLGRDVAIKILPATLAADPQRRSRFEREARAVAALNHPNICTIHDVGHDQGVDFLVMELVDGESLAARLTRGPLPLDQALARAIEIADALDRAHSHGIVHRDLKPGNIMLARAGSGTSPATHAKLLDFGLARIVPAGVASVVSPTASSPMTEVGAMLGTLQYMAPEQVEGRPADARTDIFAFGALLYEMVTGRRAFEGATTASLMAAILQSNPPAVLPHSIGRIVQRCLEKDPLRRYQSARDLLNDLEEARAAPTESPRRVSRKSGVWLALPALAVAAMLGYIVWAGSGDHAPTPIERFNLQPPSGVQVLQTGPNPVLAMSPDGRWVAFQGYSSEPGKGGLYLRSIGEIEANLATPAGTAPFFSPDSGWLGFFAANAMHKMPVAGGRPERICEVPNVGSVRGVHWGDNGTIVVSLDRALWSVPSRGGELTRLTKPPATERHYWPHVLPGGAAALFVVNHGYNDRFRRIAVVSLKNGEFRTFPALAGTAPRYVPDGYLVFSRYGALHAMRFDLSRLEVTGEDVKVFDGVNSFMQAGSTAADVSASGSLVYITGSQPIVPDGELIWLDRKGTITPFLPDPKLYVGAAIDPDGRRVAAAVADELGEADLRLYDIGRGSWTQLTNGMHVWSELAWSADGKSIFFTSFRSGEAELFRIASNGGQPEQLTTNPNAWEYPGSVSPDGKTLLFWQMSPSQGDLMTLTLEPRGSPEHFTPSSTFIKAVPRISPNGLWVTYTSNETGSGEVHVRPFGDPGTLFRVSTTGGFNPWWSRDGRELFYQRDAEIWAVTVNPGPTFSHSAPRLLFETTLIDGSVGPVDIQGIGDRFLAIRRRRPVDYRIIYVPNWLDEMKQTLRSHR